MFRSGLRKQSGRAHSRRVSFMALSRERRLDLNHPPTSVGGIHSFRKPSLCRPDLNHPPTSVGGILSFDDSHRRASAWSSPLSSHHTPCASLPELVLGSLNQSSKVLPMRKYYQDRTGSRSGQHRCHSWNWSSKSALQKDKQWDHCRCNNGTQ